MPEHVLVPVDGSDRSWRALEYAVALFATAHLTVLYVVDPAEGDYYLDEMDRPVEQSKEIQTAARERVRAAGGTGRDVTIAVEDGKPAQTIIDHAEKTDVDHVVVGSRGRTGFSRLLLGSVAETVIRRSPVPVTVVRENEVSS